VFRDDAQKETNFCEMLADVTDKVKQLSFPKEEVSTYVASMLLHYAVLKDKRAIEQLLIKNYQADPRIINHESWSDLTSALSGGLPMQVIQSVPVL
jgi:hypothetical protein